MNSVRARRPHQRPVAALPPIRTPGSEQDVSKRSRWWSLRRGPVSRSRRPYRARRVVSRQRSSRGSARRLSPGSQGTARHYNKFGCGENACTELLDAFSEFFFIPGECGLGAGMGELNGLPGNAFTQPGGPIAGDPKHIRELICGAAEPYACVAAQAVSICLTTDACNPQTGMRRDGMLDVPCVANWDGLRFGGVFLCSNGGPRITFRLRFENGPLQGAAPATRGPHRAYGWRLLPWRAR
jgi:hypothetical protein